MRPRAHCLHVLMSFTWLEKVVSERLLLPCGWLVGAAGSSSSLASFSSAFDVVGDLWSQSVCCSLVVGWPQPLGCILELIGCIFSCLSRAWRLLVRAFAAFLRLVGRSCWDASSTSLASSSRAFHVLGDFWFQSSCCFPVVGWSELLGCILELICFIL